MPGLKCCHKATELADDKERNGNRRSCFPYFSINRTRTRLVKNGKRKKKYIVEEATDDGFEESKGPIYTKKLKTQEVGKVFVAEGPPESGNESKGYGFGSSLNYEPKRFTDGKSNRGDVVDSQPPGRQVYVRPMDFRNITNITAQNEQKAYCRKRAGCGGCRARQTSHVQGETKRMVANLNEEASRLIDRVIEKTKTASNAGNDFDANGNNKNQQPKTFYAHSSARVGPPIRIGHGLSMDCTISAHAKLSVEKRNKTDELKVSSPADDKQDNATAAKKPRREEQTLSIIDAVRGQSNEGQYLNRNIVQTFENGVQKILVASEDRLNDILRVGDCQLIGIDRSRVTRANGLPHNPCSKRQSRARTRGETPPVAYDNKAHRKLAFDEEKQQHTAAETVNDNCSNYSTTTNTNGDMTEAAPSTKAEVHDTGTSAFADGAVSLERHKMTNKRKGTAKPFSPLRPVAMSSSADMVEGQLQCEIASSVDRSKWEVAPEFCKTNNKRAWLENVKEKKKTRGTPDKRAARAEAASKGGTIASPCCACNVQSSCKQNGRGGNKKKNGKNKQGECHFCESEDYSCAPSKKNVKHQAKNNHGHGSRETKAGNNDDTDADTRGKKESKRSKVKGKRGR